jgi:hypothetical protein
MRDIEQEEFPGMPAVVSTIRVREKKKVNDAFSHYMNVAFVYPFFQRLRIQQPEEFVEFQKCFLVVAMARHQTLGYRLVWFFFDSETETFYRWTYPQPEYSSHNYHYALNVIDDIRDVTGWDDHSFLRSSRTLDDPAFWSEYVLKYLKA